MVHYGKHIIDPQTGLCEICDRGAIHDLRRGKRPVKQFLYSNQDGKFTYRPNDEEPPYYDEPSPRQIRQPLYPPPARSRRAVYEEPVIVTKKSVRRELTPPDDSPRRGHRSKVFYEVDDEGQMYPRSQGPPEEARRRYLIQTTQSRTPRPAHVAHRRAQTPPPPMNESWTKHPRRQNNSDTESVDRRYQPQYHEPPRKAELYYLDANATRILPPLSTSRTYVSHDNLAPTPRGIQRPEESKKRYQLEPIERKPHREPEPPAERKIYRKVPPVRDDPPRDLYSNNGNHLRMTRKVETIYPTPKPYASSPQLHDTLDRSPRPNRYSTLYHLQPVDAY